jgi:hypothetical protein
MEQPSSEVLWLLTVGPIAFQIRLAQSAVARRPSASRNAQGACCATAAPGVRGTGPLRSQERVQPSPTTKQARIFLSKQSEILCARALILRLRYGIVPASPHARLPQDRTTTTESLETTALSGVRTSHGRVGCRSNTVRGLFPLRAMPGRVVRANPWTLENRMKASLPDRRRSTCQHCQHRAEAVNVAKRDGIEIVTYWCQGCRTTWDVTTADDVEASASVGRGGNATR